MNKTDGRKSRPRHRFESQDDFGYLVGCHTYEDSEKQIRTPGHSQHEGQREEHRKLQTTNKDRRD